MLEELQEIERVQEGQALSLGEVSRQMELILELKWVTLLEEISWRQKSRALWLKEGDRSTKFFRRVANSHKRTNIVERLNIDGVVCTEALVIKEHIAGFFEHFITE
ncbi:hypothetical protein I3843_13G149600 [Carya illinoinensis]|uniref:Uncharacterized protein n=1 Tax=Carya illinoinensis TaxID=32201 RepID=A0A922DEN5_CARIL|nr:hypothetical protein I3842_13G170700 [Carya illinoinensis]KAG7951092.1 hypothetical protein I3843_13G149600 [Carya illinoinensis]